MLVMLSTVGLILFILCTLAVLVVSLVRQQASAEKTANWPVTEGTIQSVGTVVVHAGRNSYSVDVGDFSYNVNDEYYSGRLTISSGSSTGDRSPRGLINQKVELRYNPQKPEEFSLLQAELDGFLLDRYNEPFGEDVDPIDLNINKA